MPDWRIDCNTGEKRKKRTFYFLHGEGGEDTLVRARNKKSKSWNYLILHRPSRCLYNQTLLSRNVPIKMDQRSKILLMTEYGIFALPGPG